MQVSITRTNADSQVFKSLIELLDLELYERYGLAQNDYVEYNNISNNDNVVIASVNGKIAGCGLIREFANDTIEIKRMFVVKSFRGLGISKNVLAELEKWAKECGYSKSILETGDKQSEAISLYKTNGYKDTEKFGPYSEMKHSICLLKEL